jgi:hypothetical protein
MFAVELFGILFVSLFLAALVTGNQRRPAR